MRREARHNPDACDKRNMTLTSQVHDRHDKSFVWLTHILFLSFTVGIYLYARFFPDRYYITLQEDHEIEWSQAVLYLYAGVMGLWYSVRARRSFDILVGLFCLFLAGEEISWGQRLLGLSTPVYLMEYNHQQELNLHNLVGGNGQHIAIIVVLAGYGIVLPLAKTWGWSSRLMERIGLTAPPAFLVPWFVVGIALMTWYPYKFTKQWVESILSSLFAISMVSLGPSRPTWKGLVGVLVSVVICSVALTHLSDALGSREGPERIIYAKREAEALLSDIIDGTAATPKLKQGTFRHDRVWEAVEGGYIDARNLTAFRQADAPTLPKKSTELRRSYAIDPWGTSYWLLVLKWSDGSTHVTVYSFGPNRRRDSDANMANPRGDDIVATGILHPHD